MIWRNYATRHTSLLLSARLLIEQSGSGAYCCRLGDRGGMVRCPFTAVLSVFHSLFYCELLIVPTRYDIHSIQFFPIQLLAKEPTTKDPKAVIEKNNAVRSNLRALEENWKQLDSAYQAEKSKRRVSVPCHYGLFCFQTHEEEGISKKIERGVSIPCHDGLFCFQTHEGEGISKKI